jgi:hypothetical protein
LPALHQGEVEGNQRVHAVIHGWRIGQAILRAVYGEGLSSLGGNSALLRLEVKDVSAHKQDR